MLLVLPLDRLGRSMPHLVTLVEQLRHQGIGFQSIGDGAIDTTTASGELVFPIFSALASSSAGSFRSEPERVCPQLGREAAKGPETARSQRPEGSDGQNNVPRTSRCRSEPSARRCASLAQHFTAGQLPNSSKQPLRSGLGV